MATETFHTTTTWVGNDGTGTTEPTFGRDSELSADGRPTIPAAPPPKFGGDLSGWSPEDLLGVAVSQCHMLWFLHLCQRNSVVVESYVDHTSTVLETQGSKGAVTGVDLRATVQVSAGEAELVHSLFDKAGELCYVARSLNCPVTHSIEVVGADPTARS